MRWKREQKRGKKMGREEKRERWKGRGGTEGRKRDKEERREGRGKETWWSVPGQYTIDFALSDWMCHGAGIVYPSRIFFLPLSLHLLTSFDLKWLKPRAQAAVESRFLEAWGVLEETTTYWRASEGYVQVMQLRHTDLTASHLNGLPRNSSFSLYG